MTSLFLAISLPFIWEGPKYYGLPSDASAQEIERARQVYEWKKAQNVGVKAKLVYKVVDENGDPVVGSRYEVGLNTHPLALIPLHGDVRRYEGLTDGSGHATVSGRCMNLIIYRRFSKEGYYDSHDTGISFAEYDYKGIKDGKWLPYGQEQTVVLKKIHNPISMYWYGFWLRVPYDELAAGCGYDLEKADWLPPLGKGEVADFIARGYWDGEEDWNKREFGIEITFPNEGDGAVFCKKDMDSTHKEPYCAPTDVEYQRKVTLRYKSISKNDKIMPEIPKDQVLVMKTRTHKKEDGVEVSSYSLFRYLNVSLNWKSPKEPWEKVMRIGIGYFFNPTPGDTNLEYDLRKCKSLYK